MLLNLSNHPSSKWAETQIAIAKQQFGSVRDMKFPNIPPEATAAEVHALAEQYYICIYTEAPKVVHLMGEMTFTFALVTILKAAGITCIASTTNRIVEERDGKKIVQFEFIRFREY